jgi:hypothetical protein
MKVNGLQLPAAFVQLCDTASSEDQTGWVLKDEVDAYGNEWSEGDLELDCDPASIRSETQGMQQNWYVPTAEELAEANEEFASYPGFIPQLGDFSKLVRFGTDGAANPFCFDFRESVEEPSVIYWCNGVYWRRVAPTFATFIALFRPRSQEDDEEERGWVDSHLEWMDEAAEEEKLDPRLSGEEQRELDELADRYPLSEAETRRMEELMARLKPR